jgi:hypothetical protein
MAETEKDQLPMVLMLSLTAAETVPVPSKYESTVGLVEVKLLVLVPEDVWEVAVAGESAGEESAGVRRVHGEQAAHAAGPERLTRLVEGLHREGPGTRARIFYGDGSLYQIIGDCVADARQHRARWESERPKGGKRLRGRKIFEAAGCPGGSHNGCCGRGSGRAGHERCRRQSEFGLSFHGYALACLAGSVCEYAIGTMSRPATNVGAAEPLPLLLKLIIRSIPRQEFSLMPRQDNLVKEDACG